LISINVTAAVKHPLLRVPCCRWLSFAPRPTPGSAPQY
jgi:hypothetical protein